MSLISQLTLRRFRCFESLRYEPCPGLNFIVGPNAQGKTSILEAACVLLRLRSPRTQNAGEMVKFGETAFALEGLVTGQENETRLSMTVTPPNRSLKLDGVSQSSSTDYLSKGRIVWFGSEDLSVVHGSAEGRRKLLDSAGLQIAGTYARDLKSHDRALRSRNLLLREGKPRREIESYDIPLAEAGERILNARRALVDSLAPIATESCRMISGETLELAYLPGSAQPMLAALEASRSEEIRLRQTRVGPQRDDFSILLNGIPAGSFASEGQRRTVALALKLALASLLSSENGTAPLLLLDDIFGELDPSRREALLAGMPRGSQALISTADLSGIHPPDGSQIHRLEEGLLRGIIG